MWRLPPRWLRRVLLAPGVLLIVGFIPFVLLGAALLGGIASWLFPGHLRLARIVWMVAFYLLWDAVAVLALFGLWIGSGFGWGIHRPVFERAHFGLARVMLRIMFWQVRLTLRLDFEAERLVVDEVPDDTPVIVVSRHAGPGDSFILVDSLLNRSRRNPHIVLKDSLQWDPAIDILLNRLSSRFVTPHSHRRPGDAGGARPSESSRQSSGRGTRC
ncbi:hypothetical protein GCM10025865_21130 [Paraoerskovia sediminicola]|uniref:Phospholipid/glycerol acyltransferase domain-containing protein n=1 Tax=Paraoerskovia sediminicola TaxID=1138587 RepID=A0ABM8G438_9CELL|nr:1-acyl-sn-glycerol-3-phosphate acyltransferase [Paraoerskovia sediminicola]BDZ42814.1 hypothetical protein GCM10025865_21130 [Paraoerskovia sediminicola]